MCVLLIFLLEILAVLKDTAEEKHRFNHGFEFERV